MKPTAKKFAADAALLIPMVVWAANFTVVHGAMTEWGSAKFAFLTARFTLATIAFIPFMTWIVWREKISLISYLKPALLVGISLIAAYWLQTSALILSTPANTAFITSLCVVLVPFG